MEDNVDLDGWMAKWTMYYIFVRVHYFESNFFTSSPVNEEKITDLNRKLSIFHISKVLKVQGGASAVILRNKSQFSVSFKYIEKG